MKKRIPALNKTTTEKLRIEKIVFIELIKKSWPKLRAWQRASCKKLPPIYAPVNAHKLVDTQILALLLKCISATLVCVPVQIICEFRPDSNTFHCRAGAALQLQWFDVLKRGY